MNRTKTTIIVKPVDRVSYQGRKNHNFKYVESGEMKEGQNLRKNKAVTASGLSTTDVYVFKRKSDSTGLDAGMLEQVPNPWVIKEGDDIEAAVYEVMQNYSLHQSWQQRLISLLKLEKITRQTLFEIQDGVEPNTYTEERSRRTGLFPDPDTKTTFLENFRVVLYDGANIFSDDTPRGRMSIQLIKKRSDRIAPSVNEINSSIHTHYIAEVNEEIKASKRRNDLVNLAIAKMVMLQQNYPTTGNIAENKLYQISTLLTDENNKTLVKGKTNPLFVEDRLNDYLKTKSKNQEANADAFLKLVDLFENNKALFHVKYIVQQGFNVNTFFNNSGYVFWNSQKNTPERYKYSSREALERFIYAEYEKYNPDEPLTNNAYGLLISELKELNAVV